MCESRVYLLSGDVCIRARGRPALSLSIGRHVQEVPDEDGVVMGTADDLELVKLQPKHAPRVLLKNTHTHRTTT